MKTKEEHLKYSIGILQRGDKIKDVMRYLDHQKVDEATHDDIINELYQMLEEEKIGQEPVQETKTQKISINLILGIMFIVAGLAFIQPFWHRGKLILLPFVIFGYGVYKVINHFNTVRK